MASLKMEDNMASETLQSLNEKVDMKDAPTHNPETSNKVLDINTVKAKGSEDLTKSAGSQECETSGDVNMEASITSDDIIRAGGFGARDDMNSFLPVAIDSTDFEASLRDARDYEEPQGKLSRPGLGWTEAMESEEN